jgi:outer membrane lipoprotein SlyB
MKTVVGILTSQSDAELTSERLREAGIPSNNISLLTPGSSPSKVAEVPTTETEQPGMGAAMGGVVGGALGAAGGMGLGAAIATLLVPGVGAVLAIGLGGAALLGAGGAIGGAVAGGALEDSMARGLPIDELFVYEDALRRGRSVVIVFAEDDVQANAVQEVFQATGAESVDAARENWWVGLRENEGSQNGENFETKVTSFRHGFEAAQHPSIRGKSYNEAADSLSALRPDEYADDLFRRGYQRGQAYYRDLLSRKGASSGKQS